MSREPGRPGFLRSLPLPSRREAVAIAVLLTITAICVGASAWYASNRKPPAFTASPEAAASASGPDSASGSEAATGRAPVLAFYGDSYVAGTAEGGVGPAGWPALVSQRVGAQAAPLHAVRGAGYVAAAPSTGDTYVTLTQDAPEPAADVTVVFGTRNDFAASPDAIHAAATQVFSTIRAAAPDTRLLVIGPVWTDAAVPVELPGVRDAVRRAAEDADATFVDPLAERWFFDNTELIGADVVHPTDEGHAYLADRIEPAVRQLLVETPGTDSGVARTTDGPD